MKKLYTREFMTSIVTVALTVLGGVLFALGFSTGYYTYGQMTSGWITAALCGALVTGIAQIILAKIMPDKLVPKFVTFVTTGLLAFAAMALIGDRVEGIGNCILTDYDSGHGGEEAIYMSLGGAVALLTAMVFNIIGAFGGVSEQKKPAGKIALGAAGALLACGILVPSLILGGVFGGKATSGTATASGNPADVAGTYTVRLSGAEGNVDLVQDYQFQCGNLQGLLNYDTRLTLDLRLTLNEDGTYSLFSDAYAIEAGQRAVIGDSTGLGMISQMTAEGTYTVNEDGTVTTSPASHAVFELALYTYSSQMRSPASYKLGEDEMQDGKYDSADYPAILDNVPETVWTLASGTIVSYGKPLNVKPGAYTIRLSGAEGNVDLVQSEQFQCGSLAGLLSYDTRLTLDLKLTLNADGTYSLFSDAYAIEAGQRAVIGDSTGLGMISQMTAEGTYTVNEDGTVTTSPASHAIFELALDTYSSQMRSPASYKLGEDEMQDGKYDSADHPAILDRVPEATWTLGSDFTIVSYAVPEEAEEQPAEEQPAEAPAAEGVTILSDDEGTKITFNPDGTYVFAFDAYGIEDPGTYTFEGGVLTLTDKNGKTSVGEGDPIKLHYTYSDSDQLTGDYTIPASTFDFAAAPAAAEVVITSDDGGTTMTFRADGTFAFDFASYGIHEEGTYAYADGKLTVTNANGLEAAGEGDPIKLHFVSATSEQLTGDYTIPASTFDFAAEAAFAEFTVMSDDGATGMTFKPDGTYRFFFDAYGVEDLGTFTLEGGVLTLTDKNGKTSVGEGDPIKLHYTYSDSDQLTGDFTIPASNFAPAGAAEPVTFTSVDGGTTITFNGDGTYRFFFEAYGVEDTGTYTLEGGVLTVTNANGLAMTPDGGVLHYVSSMSDALTGDFAVDVSAIH